MTRAVASLGEVLSHRKEFITISETAEYKRCRVQLHAKGIVERDRVPGAMIKTKEQQLCRANELLVAEIDAKVGGFGIVPPELDGAIVSSHYFLFTPDTTRIDPAFLGYYVRTPAFRYQVNARGSTNYAAIRPRHVLEYQIPLPPLVEQRRIVAKIERLAAKIDQARSIEERSGREVELLNAALEHRIWPDQTVCNSVPLSEITTFLARGRQSEQGPSDHYLIKSQHVQMGNCRPSNLTLSPFAERSVKPEAMLRRGDILIACSAAGCLGRVAIYNRSGIKASTDTHVAIARANPEQVLPEYLFAYLHSAVGQEQLRSRERGALKNERVGFRLAELNLRDLRQVPVPLPGLSEQRRIVAYLESLQAKVDRLKALQAQTRAELDALLPSILDRAFKGEL